MLQISELRTKLIGPISLVVAPGECIAVLGTSGSGKSLLLRAIADLDPNDGDAALSGRSRNAMPAQDWRRLVSLVPAESGWWSDTVAPHFEPGCDVHDLLVSVGLPDAMGWDVARLSTGERQRLALVRSLARKPSALLLDEPTSALDDDATRRVEDIIREQCRRGVPVILVSHDKAQTKRLAERRFVMVNGSLSADDG